MQTTISRARCRNACMRFNIIATAATPPTLPKNSNGYKKKKIKHQAILFPEPWNAPACSFLDLPHFPGFALIPAGTRTGGAGPPFPPAGPPPWLPTADDDVAALASAAAAAATDTNQRNKILEKKKENER